MTKNYIPTINISSLVKNNFETQSALKTIKEINFLIEKDNIDTVFFDVDYQKFINFYFIKKI